MTIVTKSRIVNAVAPTAVYFYGVNSKNQTVAVPASDVRGGVSVTDYGAKCDGVTDDTTAIQAAIDAVAARTTVDSQSGFDSFGGVVLLPAGTYFISSTLTLKRGVKLVGAGRRATMLLVDSVNFPSNSRVITLGALGSNDFAYGSMVEGLSINCAERADLVGVESDHAAEGAGLRDVLIRGTFRPVRLYKEAALTVPASPTEVLIENCEFWLSGSGGPAAPRYAIDIDDCEQANVIRFVTVYDLNTTMGAGSAAVRVNGARAEIHHLHTEKMETGVLILGGSGDPSQVVINSLEHYNGDAVTGVYIDSASVTTSVIIDNVIVANSGTAYAVQNTATSEAITNGNFSRLSRYTYTGTSAQSVGRYSEIVLGTGSRLNKLITASASLNFGSIAAGATETLTITVTGAAVGDNVFGNPSGATTLQVVGGGCVLTYHYGVTATDTVSVRAMNIGTASGDPAAQTHDVTVLSFA